MREWEDIPFRSLRGRRRCRGWSRGGELAFGRSVMLLRVSFGGRRRTMGCLVGLLARRLRGGGRGRERWLGGRWCWRRLFAIQQREMCSSFSQGWENSTIIVHLRSVLIECGFCDLRKWDNEVECRAYYCSGKKRLLCFIETYNNAESHRFSSDCPQTVGVFSQEM